jgi:DNA-binding transcriptional MerR regulator
VRTVRYYIAEDLLPGPGSRGKGASYTEEHLLRLRLIRRLTERRAPLAEIREVMARVTPDEIRALLAEEDARSQALERAEQAVSPRDYIAALLDQARTPRKPSSQTPMSPQTSATNYGKPPRSGLLGQSTASGQASAWRRVELAPGVELHIQTATEKRYKRLIERLLQVSDEELNRQ